FTPDRSPEPLKAIREALAPYFTK
ncbi:MAG: hypothetical protein RLZZ444_4336, partial [Pseudomonadota bacterium]